MTSLEATWQEEEGKLGRLNEGSFGDTLCYRSHRMRGLSGHPMTHVSRLDLS